VSWRMKTISEGISKILKVKLHYATTGGSQSQQKQFPSVSPA
jgi:hypothetical protein